MGFAIETVDLTKIYGSKVGCEKVCLKIPEGQIFGFLGPNGAGKSTLVKMLVGLLRPTSGSASILGQPLSSTAARKRIGFLPEAFRYHDWLTGRELLGYHAAMYGMDGESRMRRIPLVSELTGISKALDRKVRGYSKGMQQRIGLACALLPDPDLLFLDEPTSALDPLGRREVRELLLAIRERGKTVFLNSHLLSEVEMICDCVAFIKEGRIIVQGPTSQVCMGSVEVEMQVEGLNENIRRDLEAHARLLEVHGETVRLTVDSREDIPELAGAVVRGGGRLFGMNRTRLSLEDVFVNLLREAD